ncbi:GTPase [Shouchella patagoniensis]|uniref:GTPase n=1 Tax=Shouchella patagoniensis TaxID=228576 RepID=UPI000995B006|nr:GTPase [Shouchella patagoniensis]
MTYSSDQFNDNYDQEFSRIYEKETEAINAQLDKEILFALIGDVNTGKSSTINQLMGAEVAKVGSQPGATSNVDLYKFKDKISFADTPGLDDIISDHSDETMAYYKQADVLLFFLNAAGTVFSEGEKQIFERMAKLNQDIIIVLNKIDAAEEISSLKAYVQKHTGNHYPVVPISSKNGTNIDQLRDKILDILEKKQKDIQLAKELEGKKAKSSVANKWIVGASAAAAGVGATPIPGADIIPITSIQVGLMVKLASLYDKPMTKKKAKNLVVTTLVSNFGQTMYRQLTKFFPGAAFIAGTTIAGTVTAAFGYSVKYAFEHDIDLSDGKLGDLIRDYLTNWRKKE